MKNIDFDVYLTNTLRLAGSLVIKMEELAKRDNYLLESSGYPVSADKRQWRYYMNLNGDYHPTDDVMYVNSSDTEERIVFSKENLALHKATLREYKSQGYWYQRLITEYPHQTALIRGILSPIPYDETISADNYKILRYDESLVQWNEDQLIPGLQKQIKAIVQQTFGNEYMNTEDLMLPVMIMNLIASCDKAIHLLRLNAIGRRYAHEFYVWSHINSFGDYRKYKDVLDRYQTMWLYRNIAWITNNPGQQFTFNLLMENLLSHAQIPLAKYDLVESTENQLKDYTPTPNYRRMSLNLFKEYGTEPTYIDTAELIDKQVPMARDNLGEKDYYELDALSKGKYSLHSEIPTKVLESSMKDYTNRHLDSLMSITRNEWIYLTFKKQYVATVLLTDPRTGRQFRINSTDAYHMWNWLCKKGQGIELEYVCPVNYYRVMVLKEPTVDYLVKHGGIEFIHPKIAENVINEFVPVKRMISPEALIEYSYDVYQAMWNHKKIYAQFYDINMRARTKLICSDMYVSGVCELGKYELYDEIFDKYEIVKSDFSEGEAALFAWDIFKAMTGWDFYKHLSLRVKQSDLIELMLKMSSYTIHTVVNMDDGTDVTEVSSETFIGNSSMLGIPGTDMEPSLLGVRTSERSRVVSDNALDSSTVLPTVNNVEPDITVSVCLDLKPNEGYVVPLERTVEESTVPVIVRGHVIPVDVTYDNYAKYGDELYLGVLPKDL